MAIGSAGHMVIVSGLLGWNHLFRDEVLGGVILLVIVALLLPGDLLIHTAFLVRFSQNVRGNNLSHWCVPSDCRPAIIAISYCL